MSYTDHEFDPMTEEQRAAEAREEELARKIRREVRRVQSGEAEEDLRADEERETAEREAREESERREKRRRSSAFWLWISGSILVRDSVSEYYRYMLAIAGTFLVSISVMFMTLHLDVQFTRLKRDVQMLRERSLRLEEQKFRTTTHSAIVRQLQERGIALYDPFAPGEVIEN